MDGEGVVNDMGKRFRILVYILITIIATYIIGTVNQNLRIRQDVLFEVQNTLIQEIGNIYNEQQKMANEIRQLENEIIFIHEELLLITEKTMIMEFEEKENHLATFESLYTVLSLIGKEIDIVEDLNIRVDEIENMWDKLNFGKFTATAYSPFDNVSGIENDGDPNYTATGTYPDWGTFAVDPDIIPYGSQMIVIGEDFIEHGIALDTGGTMRRYDTWIDLFRDHYWQTVDFGVQDVVVIWKEGGKE